MKQHITEKQWYNLDPEKMAKVFSTFNREYIEEEWFKYWKHETVKRKVFDFRPTIGQMIEFLGDNLCRIKHEIYNDDEYKLQMEVFNTKWTWIVIMYDRTFLHEELCDALWDATKIKLNQ